MGKVKLKELEKDALLEALNLVKPALGKAESLSEIFSHFAFDGETVMTTNEFAFIQTPIKTGVRCTVIAEPFHNLVNSIKDKQVEMEIIGTELNLKTKSIGSKFRTLELSQFPKPSKFSQKGNRIPVNFFKALELCMKSVFTDRSDPLLRSIAIENGDMMSSDISRLSFFPLDPSLSNMLIPIEAAEVIIALRDQILSFDIVKEAKWESWIGFNLSTGGIMTAKLMEGKFPVEKSNLNLKDFTIPIVFPNTILTTIERCKYFTSGTNKDNRNTIALNFKDNKVNCKLENSAIGEFTEVLDMKTSLNVILKINLEHLDTITKTTLTAKLQQHNPNMIMFHNDELNYKQIIALEE
jgi:hypothetical protein